MGRRRRSQRQAGPADDTQLVADFVRRRRRVALHPLALDDQDDDDRIPPLPGDLLRRLMEVPTTMDEHDDGTVTLRSPLPGEVQFESLACSETFRVTTWG